MGVDLRSLKAVRQAKADGKLVRMIEADRETGEILEEAFFSPDDTEGMTE